MAPGNTGTAVSLNNLGTAALALRDYDAARAAYEESLRLSRQQGYQYEAAWAEGRALWPEEAMALDGEAGG